VKVQRIAFSRRSYYRLLPAVRATIRSSDAGTAASDPIAEVVVVNYVFPPITTTPGANSGS
jgi:hypothetical protein